MSSARWRSERPPTVFDWLIRAWVRNRRGLDTAELRHGHEDVEDLRGGHVFRWLLEDLLDVGVPVFEVALQLGALHADVIRALQSLHALIA